MKTHRFLVPFLLMSVALFTSCDPNAIEGSSNYWESSTLTRMHLNGKVKTLTTNNGTQATNFNQDGYITSQVYTSSNGTSTTTYNYAASGELTSTDFTSTMGNPTISYSTNYQYQNVGKYVVEFPYPEHLMMNGLVPNLKSVSYNNGSSASTVSYTFAGNTLTILTVGTSESMTYKDTAYVTYSGKYPVSMSHSGSYAKNITYASNGMFKTVTTGYQGSNNETNYYFKEDNKFQLTDSVISNYGTTHYSQKYTYDTNKNVTRIVYSDGTINDYSYVYDSQGNWTTKTTTYSGTMSGSSTETRTITYW
jgi:hypothetical protein